MFINVAYKDAPELSTVFRRDSSESDLSLEKTLLVNPNCPVRIMLEYIRKKCKLGLFTNFDLCDESGNLMGLFNLATYSYATDRFEHKNTYYIIVLKTESNQRISILPQLNHDNFFYQELKNRVNKFIATTPEESGGTGSKGTPPPKVGPPVKATPPAKGKK